MVLNQESGTTEAGGKDDVYAFLCFQNKSNNTEAKQN